jgi:hypothetical protein
VLDLVRSGILELLRSGENDAQRAAYELRGVMQIHSGACSPEKLKFLQKVFDAIWMELESKHSKHTFPWDTQSARFRIANYLLEHVNDAKLDIDGIKRGVLQRLEQKAPVYPRSGNSPRRT